MTRLQSPTQQIDIAALDLIRDRERGVPRFNEFRRQYGLRQLTSFDDFIDSDVAGRAETGTDAAGRDAARGLRPAPVRRVKADHRRAA